MTPEPPLRVLARIHLLSSEDGGRTHPLVENYRPNHRFFEPNDSFAIGQIYIPDGEKRSPGETFDAIVDFLPWDQLDLELVPGREWTIQEGSKVVGRGMVIERFSPETC